MSDFVKYPNLPEGRVTLAVLRNIPELTAALQKLGMVTLSPEPDAVLPEEVSEHADMLLCHTGENICFLAPGQEKLKEALATGGFSLIVTDPPGKAYPEDVKLNVAVGGAFAAGAFAHTDATLFSALRESGRTLVNVKQGYAKCSLCFITENAFITEDASLEKALSRAGADVLKISSGDVYLSDVHSGFFGGASGKIAPDTLAVTGSLAAHRDGDRIRKFAASHGVGIEELRSGRITDIGGILPLKNDE